MKALLTFLIVALLLGSCTSPAPMPAVPRATIAPSSTPAPSFTPTPSSTPLPTQPIGWTLTWSDEFDGPDGSLPDPAKWDPQTGGEGWGNAEFQHYTERTENIRLEDGFLVIEAIKEKYKSNPYTSGRLQTRDIFTQAYGRFEARMKLPYGQGIWPAFWMLGDDFITSGWPGCGEIDIMEHIGKEPSTVYANVHGPNYFGGNGVSGSYTLPGGQRLTDDFHTFWIEWEPEQIRWYIDGRLYHSVTPADLPPDGKWVFDHPFFLVINLAVGGLWPGYPDTSTTFPQFLLVDYVRVYSK